MQSVDLSNITSNTWAQSITHAGKVVQDMEVIRQRWFTALSTPAGSVPLDPFFASEIFSHLDKPMQLAAPMIRAEILKTAKAYLPEIAIKNISYVADASGGVTFEVNTVVDGQAVKFDLKASSGLLQFDDYGGRLVLVSPLPINAASITVSLQLNSTTITPSAPGGGFATADDMLAWLVANWGNYGTFTKGKDVLVMVPETNYVTGKIAVTAL